MGSTFPRFILNIRIPAKNLRASVKNKYTIWLVLWSVYCPLKVGILLANNRFVPILKKLAMSFMPVFYTADDNVVQNTWSVEGG